MSSHLHVNTCSTLVQWESHTLSTPTSDNSPSFQVHSQLPQPTCSWKWHPNTCQLGNPTTSPKNADIHRNISVKCPPFFFYRDNFIFKWWNWTIPLKEFMMRIVGTYIWWSKLVFVRSLAFCNLVLNVQANIWPPGLVLSLWVWSGPGTATTISHLWNFGTRPIYHLGSRKIVRIEGDTLFYSPFVLRHCFQHPFSYSS